ncbi:MAG: hypothetical protein FWG67_06395 [Defluviitaleaceae bacterium]|nr:hypothetical protein [Defluviitaleaceae bacterium]
MLKILIGVVGVVATTLAILQGVNVHISSASHPERTDFVFSAHQTHSRQITFRPSRGNIRAAGTQIAGSTPTTYGLRRALNNGAMTRIATITISTNNARSSTNVLLGTQNATLTNQFRVDMVRDTPRASANTFRLFAFIQ